MNRAGARVTPSVRPPVPAPPVYLLDELTAQPLWAHWLGGLLLTGQTAIGAVRNVDTLALADLADFLTGRGVVRASALEAFADGSDVELVNVANAADGATLDGPKGQRALVCEAGVAVLGDGGYVSARFSNSQYVGCLLHWQAVLGGADQAAVDAWAAARFL